MASIRDGEGRYGEGVVCQCPGDGKKELPRKVDGVKCRVGVGARV